MEELSLFQTIIGFSIGVLIGILLLFGIIKVYFEVDCFFTDRSIRKMQKKNAGGKE